MNTVTVDNKHYHLEKSRDNHLGNPLWQEWGCWFMGREVAKIAVNLLPDTPILSIYMLARFAGRDTSNESGAWPSAAEIETDFTTDPRMPVLTKMKREEERRAKWREWERLYDQDEALAEAYWNEHLSNRKPAPEPGSRNPDGTVNG